MEGRIPTNIVKQRSRYLTDVCMTISKLKNKEDIGKKYTLLITKVVKKGTYIGRSDNYKPVIIKGNFKLGDFITTEIIDSDSIHPYGKLI